jgi:hypothetical protein
VPKPRWSDDDRQRHADRDILKSRKVPSKRQDGPSADEWEDTNEETEEWASDSTSRVNRQDHSHD